ncbi:MAG: ABC transporter ATP-binding protein [Thermoleophilaceae bacterium]|nr:ABC transporter ATP-binding protein [Thermoleophilaceae bacterium]
MSAPPADGPLIKLENVSRSYEVGAGEVVALEAVDLEVRAGEFVAVLGASGSGKTTLLNVIGALDAVSSGTVTLGGHAVTGASRKQLAEIRRTRVSFIFQTFNLFPGLTALENVAFGAEVAGRSDPRLAALETLTQVDLANRVAHFPHELSGGEQQRVAIARALATGNQVLLADEPTGELDFATGVQILQLLRDQARGDLDGNGQGDRAVIVVTHNREIARVADRVIELSSGRVVSDAPPVDAVADIASLHW